MAPVTRFLCLVGLHAWADVLWSVGRTFERCRRCGIVRYR
jgi:hypothetical protein